MIIVSNDRISNEIEDRFVFFFRLLKFLGQIRNTLISANKHYLWEDANFSKFSSLEMTLRYDTTGTGGKRMYVNSKPLYVRRIRSRKYDRTFICFGEHLTPLNIQDTTVATLAIA